LLEIYNTVKNKKSLKTKKFLKDIYIISVMDKFTQEIKHLLTDADEACAQLLQELYGEYSDKYTLHFSNLYDKLRKIRT
jgi:hypothetical protein